MKTKVFATLAKSAGAVALVAGVVSCFTASSFPRVAVVSASVAGVAVLVLGVCAFALRGE